MGKNNRAKKKKNKKSPTNNGAPAPLRINDGLTMLENFKAFEHSRHMQLSNADVRRFMREYQQDKSIIGRDPQQYIEFMAYFNERYAKGSPAASKLSKLGMKCAGMLSKAHKADMSHADDTQADDGADIDPSAVTMRDVDKLCAD